jgi:predicted signal transduction protein with EAL and GGDEF domain
MTLRNGGARLPRERTILKEELCALGLLFIVCATIFVWRRILEERQDRKKRQAAETELQEQWSLAMADPLTGLPNRREFLRVLQPSLDHHEAPTVYLLDLNGFKAINDRFGHEIGRRGAENRRPSL